ncbi:MAG: redox-regulated ATPase YchF [Fibrobacterota bacterium]
MKIGIIGLPQSGKTTIFNALTGMSAETGITGVPSENIASVKVPDERLDWLNEKYQPAKFSPAAIDYMDIAGAIQGETGKKEANEALNKMRESDALLQVVRFFDNDNVLHPKDTIDPERDFEDIKTELIFSDLDIAEKRAEKLRKTVTVKGPDQQKQKNELAVLERIIECLGEGGMISDLELAENESKMLRGYCFLTEKPVITMLNVDETRLKNPDSYRGFTEKHENVFIVSADVEMEISRLEDEDKAVFLEDLGIEEPASTRLIKACYEMLGLVSFFTCGEDEVKAWTVNRGDTAVRAASKIHSDIARGFIRAEIMAFDDLKEAGSEKELRNKELQRLEGKEYVVKDGDIAHFKFNV